MYFLKLAKQKRREENVWHSVSLAGLAYLFGHLTQILRERARILIQEFNLFNFNDFEPISKLFFHFWPFFLFCRAANGVSVESTFFSFQSNGPLCSSAGGRLGCRLSCLNSRFHLDMCALSCLCLSIPLSLLFTFPPLFMAFFLLQSAHVMFSREGAWAPWMGQRGFVAPEYG